MTSETSKKWFPSSDCSFFCNYVEDLTGMALKNDELKMKLFPAIEVNIFIVLFFFLN